MCYRPAPLGDEEQTEEDVHAELGAGQELEKDRGRLCYSSELKFPLEDVPANYEAIVCYFNTKGCPTNFCFQNSCPIGRSFEHSKDSNVKDTEHSSFTATRNTLLNAGRNKVRTKTQLCDWTHCTDCAGGLD